MIPVSVLLAALVTLTTNPVPAGPGTFAAPRAGAPVAGSAAPDFAYQGADGVWRNLHDLLGQGSVLLVFGADGPALRSLQQFRDELLRVGIVPVAVVEGPDRDAWRAVQSQGLTYSVLSDPQASIAEQFGVADPASRHARPSWIVIDAHGRIRDVRPGTAPGDWTRVASSALGRTDVQAAGAR